MVKELQAAGTNVV